MIDARADSDVDSKRIGGTPPRNPYHPYVDTWGSPLQNHEGGYSLKQVVNVITAWRSLLLIL